MSERDTLDVSSLRTPDQIAAAFAALAKEEDDVNEELHALLSQQSLLEQRLRGLSSTTPQMLHSASGDARKLGKVIDFTAKLAEGVAVKVRQLDLAKVRIRVKWGVTLREYLIFTVAKANETCILPIPY